MLTRLATLILATSVAGAALASPPSAALPKRVAFLNDALELTPLQQKQVLPLHSKLVAQSRDTKQKLKAERKALRKAWRDNANAATVRQHHSAVAALKAELRTGRLEFHLDVRELLTPVQKEKLSKLMARKGGKKRGKQSTRL